MNNFLKFFIILLITQTIFSCKNSQYSNKVVNAKCDTTLNLDTPSFKRLNVIDQYNRVNVSFEFIQRDIKTAGLRDYKNGYDSILLRFWNEYSNSRQDIIEIRKNCEGWIGQHTEIKWRIVDSTVTSNFTKNVFLNPKSGWDKFAQKIFNLNVTTLPDFSEISNYDAPNDGQMITVEISTKNFYRIYSYISPRANEQFNEARDVVNIIKLLEKEFDIKLF